MDMCLDWARVKKINTYNLIKLRCYRIFNLSHHTAPR